MEGIKKVAVLGSGVMGSSIAAHIANSDTQVVLLDIVPENAKDRNVLAKSAIEKLIKSNPAAFTHKNKAKNVITGNLEDNLDLLKDVDWIIEAVLEDIDIKQSLYKKIQGYKKDSAIISSNTSTIPLNLLTNGMDGDFKKKFFITHFFNPPRYMRLFELVAGDECNKDDENLIKEFADIKLGKGVVICKDTPGFIANRIGCFWMTCGVLDALETEISIEDADQVMSRPIGVPKTGVFGLLDLIGIDLMPLIAKAFANTLPKDDAFIKNYREPEIITNMIKDGYTGRKGEGGFYRLNTDDGQKIKEAVDLKNGKYHTAIKGKLESLVASKSSLRELLTHGDIGGVYARKVLLKTLSYAASLVPQISDDILSVDEAMRLGYNWKYGPFELIDKLQCSKISGPKWLAGELEKDQIEIPKLLLKAGDNNFYKEENSKRYYLNTDGEYCEILTDENSFMLLEKKIGKKPILKNPSAKLWDIGDDIVCFEFTSKMNSLDPLTLELLAKTTELVAKDYRGLVIANDADNFCVGANIGFLLFAANTAAFKTINGIIKQGQDTYMGLKYAPFPVVSAVSGMALGGGCELMLHSDSIVAHIETYSGLVEVGVGVVPGWGGCKEMLYRNLVSDSNKKLSLAQKGGMFMLSLKQAVQGDGSASLRHPINTLNVMPAITNSFMNIGLAKVAKSAEEARDMLILRDSDIIVMNRNRVLGQAKQKCLSLAEGYEPPKTQNIRLPGKTAKTAIKMAIDGFVKVGKATDYDVVVSDKLSDVLSGGKTDITEELSEQDILDLELEAFMYLIKQERTLDRIEHMLETGKPLRN